MEEKRRQKPEEKVVGIDFRPPRELSAPKMPAASQNQTSLIRRLGWSLAIIWTIFLAISLIWNLRQVHQSTQELALVGLRISFEKDVLYRHWATEHGGAYVPAKDKTPPNPNLKNIPERDMETPSDRRLTLVNPTYLSRQVHELGKIQYWTRGHITSLYPLRPENAPDPWEKEKLQEFLTGVKEVSAMMDLDGDSYMRLMRPFITEQGCLKCHAQQGYRLGDIRGGISVSTPMRPYQTVMHSRQIDLTVVHALIWILGLVGIGWLTGRIGTSERRRLEVQEEIRSTLYGIGDGVISTDVRSRVTRMNPVAEYLTGWKEVDAQDRHLKEVFTIMNERTRAEADSPVDRVLDKGLIVGLANHTLLIARDGTERPIADSCAPIRNEEGIITGAVLIFRDQTAERSAQKALQDSEEKYRIIFENAVEGFYQSTPEGQFVTANPALARMLGYDSPKELLRGITDLSKQSYVNPEDRMRFQKIIEEQGFVQGFEVQNFKKDGSKIWISINARSVKDEAGKVLCYEGTIEDITERKKMEDQLQKMSIIDELTGLYNRRGFLTLAGQELKMVNRTKRETFLLFADLDGLKEINDTFGHLEGDQALIAIAHIFKKSFREPDILARIGGDEFVILAREWGLNVGPGLFMERLRKNMGLFNEKTDRNYKLSLSMGMVAYDPKHPVSIETLLVQADTLMYEEKKRKKDSKINF